MDFRLRIWLRSSAIYDLVVLALLLAMPGFLFEFFAHPRPADAFLFRLAALPLWMCPVIYWMASRDARRESPLVRASVLLRLVGAVGIIALVVWHRPAGAGAYWTFAAADLGWGLGAELLRRRA